MSSVSIAGNTSGSVTLLAPDVAGNTTLTLPTTSGTIATLTTAGFASGTKMSFYQASAPTGWTKDTTSALNDAVLRIVTGSGGVTGGSTAFSTWAAASATSAYTLTTSDIPSHTHNITVGSGGAGNFIVGDNRATAGSSAAATNATGGGGGHSHGLSQNIKYADFIVASKD